MGVIDDLKKYDYKGKINHVSDRIIDITSQDLDTEKPEGVDTMSLSEKIGVATGLLTRIAKKDLKDDIRFGRSWENVNKDNIRLSMQNGQYFDAFVQQAAAMGDFASAYVKRFSTRQRERKLDRKIVREMKKDAEKGTANEFTDSYMDDLNTYDISPRKDTLESIMRNASEKSNNQQEERETLSPDKETPIMAPERE